ncbi:type IA DNA topoisomerase [Helicobacter sp. 12S02232-10]|uniref:type IA DNA topoisomerase n=1 Tax=Helicobacter sp. 12S02232-10 TaxID=1476197 RepID=UPI002150CA76|nr:type IA DNA topoisomerase [Helicobacter sp. 12S02232-10]
MNSKDSVIIIESPNKVKKIAGFTGARVFATIGHFMELKNIETDNNYKPVFDYVASKKQSIFSYINACKGKKVYVATDPDREGYGIGYMFYSKIKNVAKEVYRAEFHEITESGVEKGLREAVLFENTNKKYYEAFLGRRVSDMLIGYTLSPYISNRLNIKGLSAGRVQTPALSLITDRENEIRAFDNLSEDEKLTYQIQAKILINSQECIIKQIAEDKEFKFNTLKEAQEEIQKLSGVNNAMLISIEKKEVKSNPPKPYTTSKLLKDGSKKLKISTKEVQDIAQKLFEAGLITYIRTDSEFLSQEYLKSHQIFYQNLYPETYQYTEYKAGKNSQAEAHEAIRITHPHKLEDLKAMLQNENIAQTKEIELYKMIFLNTLCSQSKAAVYENTTLNFKIKMNDFRLSFKNLIYEGYLKLLKNTGFGPNDENKLENNSNALDSNNQEIDDDKDNNNLANNKINSIENPINLDISKLKPNDLIPIKEIFIKALNKNAPKRYLESDFIEVLEKKGIGRPSTYATYTTILSKREYILIEDKKREIAPTQRGMSVIEFFKNDTNAWILDIAFTKEMEEKLDLIAQNEESYINFMKQIHSKIGNEIKFSGGSNTKHQSQSEQSEKSKGNNNAKGSNKIPSSQKQIDFCKAIAQTLNINLPKNLEKTAISQKTLLTNTLKNSMRKNTRKKMRIKNNFDRHNKHNVYKGRKG